MNARTAINPSPVIPPQRATAPLLAPALMLVLALLSLTATPLLAAERLTPYQETQVEADQAYANGDYRTAYGKYQTLARKGDSFAQYRMSYMNFQGQGVETDWAEAFAWAVLASQSNNPVLVKYMAALARELPEDQHRRAAIKAKNYLDRWGDLAVAEDARRGAINEMRRCTGSRLGTRCEEVYSMQMPRFWDTGASHSPFIGQSDETKGSISSSTGNGAGGEVLNTEYYQNMRWAVRDLERYLADNAGNVQIGDLETLGDD